MRIPEIMKIFQQEKKICNKPKSPLVWKILGHPKIAHVSDNDRFPFDYHYCATCPTRIRLNTLLGPPIETQSTSWAKSIFFGLLIILIPLGPNFGIWLKKVKKIKISNLWHFWKIIVTQPFLIYPRLLFLCVSTSSIFFKK